MTLDTSTAPLQSDTAATSHIDDLGERALTGAAAVARACAWGLSPAVEELRRVARHSEADALSTCARDLDTLAAALNPLPSA